MSWWRNAAAEKPARRQTKIRLGSHRHVGNRGVPGTGDGLAVSSHAFKMQNDRLPHQLLDLLRRVTGSNAAGKVRGVTRVGVVLPFDDDQVVAHAFSLQTSLTPD